MLSSRKRTSQIRYSRYRLDYFEYFKSVLIRAKARRYFCCLRRRWRNSGISKLFLLIKKEHGLIKLQDLISYNVVNVNPLRMEECVVGDGESRMHTDY